MFSIKSPIPKAPATKPAAVIVSHGQPSDPDPAEIVLAALADDVARALPDWRIGSATLAKPGALDAALSEAGPRPLIYPMFMTSGWFTGDELRKRLGEGRAKVLQPLGLDSGLVGMAADLLNDTMRDQGWQARHTMLFIAAHGSGRSRNSAVDTQAFAEALADRIAFAELRVGFVEEPPYLADQAIGLGSQSICLPFFAAKGGHVIEDIPDALETADFKGRCLDPIGCLPDVAGLIAQALDAARVNA